ncbi:MAG: hypothetical protein MZW92_69545 [Comamonadaceae bacterium]|nr:hypothetical protein [Comamonadaceae bacterium]
MPIRGSSFPARPARWYRPSRRACPRPTGTRSSPGARSARPPGGVARRERVRRRRRQVPSCASSTARRRQDMDVYVTAENEPLANAGSAETVGQAGGFVNIRHDTWRVRVTAAGSKTDVRLDIPGVVFDGERVYALVLSAATGGMLVDGLLLRQETRAQARLAVTQTRVRVAADVRAARR